MTASFLTHPARLRCHNDRVGGVSCPGRNAEGIAAQRREAVAASVARNDKEEPMDRILWIVAGLLAVAYLLGGGGKLLVPKAKIAAMAASGRWVEDFSAGSVKAIGALEVLAALGLILPAVLGIAPVLVPLAALGLVVIMAGAAITRLRRRETKFLVADLIYLALAGFVAWGRLFGPTSFTG